MQEVDVLVAGLGPAGASASLNAAKRGLTVAAIERKHAVGVPVQCAEFIPLPLSAYAQKDEVQVQRITGMKSVLPSGMALQSNFAGLMIDRRAFDQALALEAQSHGARLYLNSQLRSLNRITKTAQVYTSSGLLEFQYKVLIAADGPHSYVAQQLGLSPLKVVHTRQYTVDLREPYFATDVWLSDAYPGGYAWLFPKGKYANLGLGANKIWREDLKTPLDSLHQALVVQGVVGKTIHYRTGGAIPVGGLREKLVVDNVLFAGDAAGLTHPITGAGIAAAVISGERAGQAAAEFIDKLDERSLNDYEEDIRDQFADSLERALVRRQALEQHWSTQAAPGKDYLYRSGWIAFPEYFTQTS